MIHYWTQEKNKLIRIEKEDIQTGGIYEDVPVWIDARTVNREDIRILEEEYGILQEHILDILDQDELSRIEKEDEYILLIVRIPIFVPSYDISYFTIPVGLVIFPDKIITICWTDCEVLKDFSSNRVKSLNFSDFSAFVIRLLSRADITFLRYLKEINRRSTTIQNELQLSIKNNELIQLLNLEKSLVFFTTSLKSNQLLLEKLNKTRILKLDEDDREWLEDVEIDSRQAIEMAETYSDILSGMMDAFASVISNNLNIIMKKLTVISLILMIPTFIVSFFGMNVPLPFTDANWKWLGVTVILIGCVLAALLARILLTDRPVRKQVAEGPRKRQKRLRKQKEESEEL